MFSLQVNGQCCEDNPDALTHHEVLLPGHLLLKYFKEKLEDCLEVLQEAINKRLEATPDTDLKVTHMPCAHYIAIVLCLLDASSKTGVRGPNGSSEACNGGPQ
jgi:DNA-directed RNA polymerase beta subunit